MNYQFITLAASSASDYEKLASTLNVVSIVLFALAGACLTLAIFSFIKFKIPRIIGDLTGRNARKSIEEMRAENEKSGRKSYRPHPVASDRGTLTEPIKQHSGKLKKPKSQKLKKEQTAATQSAPTAPQHSGIGSGATDVLDDVNATVKLDYDENGTEVLSEGTQVLSNEQLQQAVNQTSVKFKMIQDIVLVHTEEII